MPKKFTLRERLAHARAIGLPVEKRSRRLIASKTTDLEPVKEMGVPTIAIETIALSFRRNLNQLLSAEQMLKRAIYDAREATYARDVYVEALSEWNEKPRSEVQKKLYGGYRIPQDRVEDLFEAAAKRDRAAGRVAQLCRRLRVPAEQFLGEATDFRMVCKSWGARIKEFQKESYQTCYKASLRDVYRSGSCPSYNPIYDPKLLDAVQDQIDAIRDKAKAAAKVRSDKDNVVTAKEQAGSTSVRSTRRIIQPPPPGLDISKWPKQSDVTEQSGCSKTAVSIAVRNGELSPVYLEGKKIHRVEPSAAKKWIKLNGQHVVYKCTTPNCDNKMELPTPTTCRRCSKPFTRIVSRNN